MAELILLLHCDGINPSAPPQSSPQTGHLLLPFAVAGGGVVQHRVQAGVEDNQSHGDPPGVVDGVFSRAALDDVPASQKVQQIHNMVGQKAEQHDGDDGVDDSHCFLSHSGPDPGDPPCRQRVAHQDDDGWHQGAKNQTQQAERSQTCVPLIFCEVLKAAVAPRVSFQRSHEDKDQHRCTDHTPQDHAYNQRAAGALQLQIGVRMYRGHVSIHADAGHETDAHVDIGEEQNPGDTTSEVPEHPVVPVEVVVNPKGQSEEDDDVSQRQVTDEDAEGCTGGCPEGENEKGGQVSRQTHY